MYGGPLVFSFPFIAFDLSLFLSSVGESKMEKIKCKNELIQKGRYIYKVQVGL